MTSIDKTMVDSNEKEGILHHEPIPEAVQTPLIVKPLWESSAETDAIGVAFTYRLRTVHSGDAAQFVGEAGIAPLQDGILLNCICCGKPEIPEKTLICDACESSFHMKCMKLRESQLSDIDDWVCTSCSAKQEKHKWTLGRINPGQQVTQIGRDVHHMAARECKTEIDSGTTVDGQSTPIQGVPSTSGNERETNKRQKRDQDDDFGPSTTISKKPSDNNRSESRSRISRLKGLSGSKEDGQVAVRDIDGADAMECLSIGDIDSSQTSVTASSKDIDDDVEPSFRDIDSGAIGQHHMQRLREFLSEKGGAIDEHWKVEVKKRIHSEKTFDVTFFSPDGQKFRSRPEVARFLGLVEQKKDGKVVDADTRDLSSPATRKKRKEVFRGQRQDEFSEDMEQSDDDLLDPVKRRKSESYKPSELQDPVLEIQLPFQCSDLKVEALGTLEMRSGYYTNDIIWPIGYRCSWHDGVTGSICISEVLDGGPAHPIFRVSRKSCAPSSNMPLHDNNSKQDTLQQQEGSGRDRKHQEEGLETGKRPDRQFNHVYDEDDELNMLVGNLSAFTQESTAVDHGWNVWNNRNGMQDQHEECIIDLIGEIIVESSSSSGAWKLFAERMLDRINEVICIGRCKLGCKHLGNSRLSTLRASLPAILVGFNHGEIDVEKAYTILPDWLGEDRFGFDVPVIRKYLKGKMANLIPLRPPPPNGFPIWQNVSTKFAGDLLQIWEFLCRFSDILGQKEPPSLEDLEEIVVDASEMDIGVATHRKGELLWPNQRPVRTKRISSSGCYSVALASSNIALLKIALSDLQQIASAAGPDLVLDAKRSKKKDGEGAVALKKQMGALVILNELTWPEVARRYVIGLLALKTCVENIDVTAQDRRKILHCIQGDGGNLCGALAGVAAIEADALLLATAEKQLSRWLHTGYEIDMSETLQEDDASEISAEDNIPGGTFKKPSWAIALEPVRKLATNVGARIRNCIRDALDLNPPDWAREVLEWSISRDVYKGNASGPTKRAVLSVLDKVGNEKQENLPKEEKKVEYVCPTPARVMRRCRVILRQVITPDEVRDFCNSLGGTVLGYFEDEEDNIEMSVPLITRPLDFRIIDSRLAAGSYGSSYESYAADMRQLFQNVPIVFNNRDDLIKIGEELSQQFERLYEERVLKLVDGKEEVTPGSDISTMNMNLGGLGEELMKAPWEEGVCKICGIDKDDDSTLLCDGCDAEYHIYCLVPPLSMIPEGNWYCPSCVAREKNSSTTSETGTLSVMPVMPHQQNKLLGDETNLPSLVTSMSGKDYWQLSALERVQLLKFLCHKVLESTLIRDHIDQSVEALPELQQKLRQLLMEKQNLVNKVGSRFDETSASDIMEVASKDVLVPKKRSRKSLRANTPFSLGDETTRNEIGAEDLKLQGDHLNINEPDTSVNIEGKINEGLSSVSCTPSHAQAEAVPTDHTVNEQIGTQNFPEHTLILQNGSIQTQETINLISLGHAANVIEHGPTIKNEILKTVHSSVYVPAASNLGGRSNGILQRWGPNNQIENNPCLNSVHMQDGHSIPQLNVPATPVQTEIELLEAEINKVEGELMRMAPRRECLGRDDLGRIYWALGWMGKFPWVVVEAMSGANVPKPPCAVAIEEKREQTDAMLAVDVSSNWSAYYDDECLEQLNKWLKPTSTSERTLKSALQRWCLAWSQKYRKDMDKQQYPKSKSVAFAPVNTKAATILSKKFGAISQPEESNEMTARKKGRKKKSMGEGIIRCDCLELVWATRIHCPCCHHSYETVAELQGHNNGACSWTGLEDEGQVLLTKKKMKLKGQEFNPPDLSVVLKKFTLVASNRDRILQIGYLGSKGPKFVPALMISPLLDPALHLASLYDDRLSDISNTSARSFDTVIGTSSSALDSGREGQCNQYMPQKPRVNASKNLKADSPDQENAVTGCRILPKDRDNEKHISTQDLSRGLAVYLQPTQSLDQNNTWVFKKLKTNMLDIESILSPDVLEPSRSKPDRRQAWRSFVKSASSILELVQTLTLLEHMIKADCLKEVWCNWTSLSAGVGINTLCSLALRIYALDAAIKYNKSPLGDIDTDDLMKLNKTAKKKKVQG